MIALVPARRGSKRMPGKNRSLINGISITEAAIKQALEAKIFKKIILSTDDEKLLNLEIDYDIEVHNRPHSLSGDNATLLDSIRQIILEKKLENFGVCLLLPTAPLREVKDINKAYKIFAENNYNSSVISVSKYTSPIEISWKVEQSKLVPIFPDLYRANIPKHKRSESYFFNDAIIFEKAEKFLEKDRNLFGNQAIPFIMPVEKSFFIDYECDFNIVRSIKEKNT